MTIQSRENTFIFFVDENMQLLIAWHIGIDIAWCHHIASCILSGIWHADSWYAPGVAGSRRGCARSACNRSAEIHLTAADGVANGQTIFIVAGCEEFGSACRGIHKDGLRFSRHQSGHSCIAGIGIRRRVVEEEEHLI